MKTSRYPGENINENPKNVHLPAAWSSTFVLNILLHLKITFIVLYHFSVHLPSRRWFSIWYNMIWNTTNCVWPHFQYPASSWFLLRQTRKKPLHAIVCFTIKHARVQHAARDAFDVNFISQLQSKQVKFSSHEWINKFIIANLISVIISIICSSNE